MTGASISGGNPDTSWLDDRADTEARQSGLPPGELSLREIPEGTLEPGYKEESMKQRWLMVLGVAVPTAGAALFEVVLLLHNPSPPSPQLVLGRVALMALAATTFSALMLTLIERNRKTLLTQQRRFEDLFEGSPDGLILIDSKRAILASNPKAVAMLGDPGDSFCRLCVLSQGATCE